MDSILVMSGKLQIAESAAAKDQREKADIEKLLRKSISRMKQLESEATENMPSTLSKSRPEHVKPPSMALMPRKPVARSVREEEEEAIKESLQRPESRIRARAISSGFDRESNVLKPSKTAEEALAKRIQLSIDSFPERKRNENSSSISARSGSSTMLRGRDNELKLKAELIRSTSDIARRDRIALDAARAPSSAVGKKLRLKDLF
jgi:hypothetical protein